MRVLFETNVILDLLLGREPWVETAAELVDLVERGEIAGLLGATTLTTIYYVAESNFDAQLARQDVADLLQVFDVAPVTRRVLESALQLGMPDFEDAVLHEAGREAGAEAIVTRDFSDFAKSKVAVFNPDQLLAALSSRSFEGEEDEIESSSRPSEPPSGRR